jgi:co-chaperonin GroES (HSP10)
MIKPLGNRILITPIVENRSEVLWTPAQLSRWGNGLLATKGVVMEIGPDVLDVKVGEKVHFSDSCGKPCAEGIIIREDDIAFAYEDDFKIEWVGATEVEVTA